MKQIDIYSKTRLTVCDILVRHELGIVVYNKLIISIWCGVSNLTIGVLRPHIEHE
jgi:hypothetical protein